MRALTFMTLFCLIATFACGGDARTVRPDAPPLPADAGAPSVEPDAGPTQTPDSGMGADGCDVGQHRCDRTCVADADIMTCGLRCEPCPTAQSGVQTCDGRSCGIDCGPNACLNEDQTACLGNVSVMACGASCEVCRTPEHARARCDQGMCAFDCDNGFVLTSEGECDATSSATWTRSNRQDPELTGSSNSVGGIHRTTGALLAMAVFGSGVHTLSDPGNPTGPSPVLNRAPASFLDDNYSGTYDPTTDRYFWFGGGPKGGGRTIVVHDASSLSLREEEVAGLGTPPPGRVDPAVVYDPGTDRMIGHGGLTFFADLQPGVWILTAATGPSPTWLHVVPDGRAPNPNLYGHSAVYDAQNNRMIMFGGFVGVGANLSDVWVLIDANGIGTPRWEQLQPDPPLRVPLYNHTAAYDEANNRMIVFGGLGTGPGDFRAETMILTNANGIGGPPEWIDLPTPTRPAGRDNHGAAYNPRTNQMFIFGGRSHGENDLWILDGANGL